MKRTWFTLGIIAVLVALVLLINTKSIATDVKLEIGYSAPEIAITRLDGEKVSLSDFKGKPVFINFWASWCGPCVEEMPHIQAAYERYGDRVEFLLINIWENDPEKRKAYLDKEKFTFPVYLDPKGTIPDTYRIVGIPTSYFIDPNGKIKQKILGAMDQKTLYRNLEMILEGS